jgi:hypothetical protein
MKWYKVSDKLPEPYLKVRCRVEVGSMQRRIIERDGFRLNDPWKARFSCDGDWQTTVEWRYLEGEEVYAV